MSTLNTQIRAKRQAIHLTTCYYKSDIPVDGAISIKLHNPQVIPFYNGKSYCMAKKVFSPITGDKYYINSDDVFLKNFFCLSGTFPPSYERIT